MKPTNLMLLMIVFVSLIQSGISREAKVLEEFEENEVAEITRIEGIFDDEENVLTESEKTKTAVDSEDPGTMLVIWNLESSEQSQLDLLDLNQTFTDHAAELDFPFTQKLLSNYNVLAEEKIKSYVTYERSRGYLGDVLDENDDRFVKSMYDMSKRMKFYYNMAREFGEISKMKYKYCSWGAHSFSYKEEGGEWLADYEDSDDVLEYYPLLSGVLNSVDWKGTCARFNKLYADPEDVNGDTNVTDAFREKVEQHPLALLILHLETKIISEKWLSLKSNDKQPILTLLVKLPKPSPFLGGGKADNRYLVMSKDLNEVLEMILEVHEQWLSGEMAEYSHDYLKADLEYLYSGMRIKVRGIYEKDYAEEKVDPMMQEYENFLAHLLTMVKKNSVMSGRLSNAEMIGGFEGIMGTVEGLEAEMNRRRVLMLL